MNQFAFTPETLAERWDVSAATVRKPEADNQNTGTMTKKPGPNCLQPVNCTASPRGLHCRSCHGKAALTIAHSDPGYSQRVCAAARAARDLTDTTKWVMAAQGRAAAHHAKLGLRPEEVVDYKRLRKRKFPSAEALSVIINSRRD